MGKIKCSTVTEAAVEAVSFSLPSFSSPSSFSPRLRQRFPEAFWSTPPMLTGIVLPQFVRCGKPGCRCLGGNLHGPYFYHYRRDNQRAVKRYLRREEVAPVLALCHRHRRTRQGELAERRQWAETYRAMNQHCRAINKILRQGAQK